ncbi:MAG: hypothetical protein IPK80_28730 [Nannocystis sp.]|nr:hypothetical protein [Nannocystis sp.]
MLPLRRLRRVWTALAGSLALAAAILLWIRFDTPPELVGYSVEVRSTSVRADRAPAAGPEHRYRPDSTIDVVVSPARAVHEPVVLRVLARDASGGSRLLAPPFARNAEGVLSIRGRLDVVLPLDPGVWRLDFFVTPEGDAPPDAAATAALQVADRLDLEVIAAD